MWMVCLQHFCYNTLGQNVSAEKKYIPQAQNKDDQDMCHIQGSPVVYTHAYMYSTLSILMYHEKKFND